MLQSISILSTKAIASTLRESIDSTRINFIDQDFISIVSNKIDLNSDDLEDIVLITSKNVIKSLIQSNQVSILQHKNIYCVGNSIPKLLKEFHLIAKKSFHNAHSLGAYIVAEEPSKVTFLCGNKSRPELPELLQKNGIQLQKHELYTTVLTPHKFNNKFDALLFFCPSAVESYLTDHQITNEKIICIGQTTASAIRPYSNNIILADQHKVSSVIHKTIELFQTS
jgi:uroporphyrinogen-III synthase